jgi:large subunit ribosomal protein L25
MEKALLLKAEIREKTGKHATTQLREQKKLPATVYGHKQTPLAIALDFRDAIDGLHHGHRVVDLEIDGKKETVMFKALQYDHLGKDIIHVDLMRVNVTEVVKVVVPIVLKGIAEGSKEGGVIDEHVDRLEVECTVNNIPESISVSIKDIHLGDNLYAGDVKLPASLTLISDPKLLILGCSIVAAAKSAEDLVEHEEEVPATPEVITEKKQEESEEK